MSKEKIVYIGRRTNGEKIAQAFLWGEETVYFNKLKYLIIGNVYEAVSKGNDLSIQRIPKDLGEGPADEAVLESWRVQDRLVTTYLQRKRDALNSQRSRAVTLAADALRPIAETLTFAQKRDLVDSIIDEITREVNVKLLRAISTKYKKTIKRLNKKALVK